MKEINPQEYDRWKTAAPEDDFEPFLKASTGFVVRCGDKVVQIHFGYGCDLRKPVIKSFSLWNPDEMEYEPVDFAEAWEYIRMDDMAKKAILRENFFINMREVLK